MVRLEPNQSFTLLTSSNLANWSAVSNFMAGTNGLFQCVDPMPGGCLTRFYRLKAGPP
jgi:hypothetical protein